jgi:predicted metal-dependent phosphoesterase TrpH
MKKKKYLKADLHLHTCDGIIEKDIPYNAFDLIDMGMQNGFEVLSITNHDSITFNSYLRDYALERGIVLIPGIELTLKGKHVLIYNVLDKLHLIKTFADLEQLKNKNNLLMAPHPFYPCYKSLGRHLKEWIHLFDAIELSHFYTAAFDFNQDAIQCAQQFGLPIVGTSDSHTLHQMNHTYTLIDAEKDPEAIFKAIKDNKVKVISTPLTLTHSGKILYDLILKNHLSKLAAASLYLTSFLPRF